jgi:hypothetical protein
MINRRLQGQRFIIVHPNIELPTSETLRDSLEAASFGTAAGRYFRVLTHYGTRLPARITEVQQIFTHFDPFCLANGRATQTIVDDFLERNRQLRPELAKLRQFLHDDDTLFVFRGVDHGNIVAISEWLLSYAIGLLPTIVLEHRFPSKVDKVARSGAIAMIRHALHQVRERLNLSVFVAVKLEDVTVDTMEIADAVVHVLPGKALRTAAATGLLELTVAEAM